MATNMVYKNADQVPVTLTADTFPTAANEAESGDFVRVGNVIGVALKDSDGDDQVVIRRSGVFELEVVGTNNEANDVNAAITAGDALYFNFTNDVINLWTDGVHMGYALEDVGAGDTETIRVLLRD